MLKLIFPPPRRGFWSPPYQAPPQGWTIHSLKEWDCSRLAVDAIPSVGWVVKGDVNVERCTHALKDAISRHAPFLGGRVRRSESGYPPYEIHVPPPSSDLQPFSCSIVEEPDIELLELIPYVQVGTSKPALSHLDTHIPCLQSLQDIPQDIEQCLKRNLPLLYLHFVKAKNATLICIAWPHIIMDASGAGELVNSWQEGLSHSSGVPLPLPQSPVQQPTGHDISRLLEKINIEPSWTPAHSTKFTIWRLLQFGIKILSDEYRYQPDLRALYIPASVVKEWVSSAVTELGTEQKVTRNDLISAWIYKTAFSIYPPHQFSNLTRSINVRGKHPAFPRHLITNLVSHCIHPPLLGSTLAEIPLTSLALSIRGTLNSVSNPSSIIRDAAHMERSLHANELWIPWENVDTRCCYITSWANLGLTAPSFGEGTQTVAALVLPLSLGPFALLLIDDEEGGWRVYGRLPRRAWEAMEEDLENMLKKM